MAESREVTKGQKRQNFKNSDKRLRNKPHLDTTIDTSKPKFNSSDIQDETTDINKDFDPSSGSNSNSKAVSFEITLDDSLVENSFTIDDTSKQNNIKPKPNLKPKRVNKHSQLRKSQTENLHEKSTILNKNSNSDSLDNSLVATLESLKDENIDSPSKNQKATDLIDNSASVGSSVSNSRPTHIRPMKDTIMATNTGSQKQGKDRISSFGSSPVKENNTSLQNGSLNSQRSNDPRLESPRSDAGNDGNIKVSLAQKAVGGQWRKVSNEPNVVKTPRDSGSVRDLDFDDISEIRSSLSRDSDYNYSPTGRKFTRKEKSSRAGFGSSTTLSSNTETSEDNDDVFNVVLRVRPFNTQESSRKDKFVVDFPGDGQVGLNSSGTKRNFQFNVVFEPDASQEDLFESSGIKKLVENALNGYTCTAFAFGQTGSGKTHTMTGPPAQFHQEGVTPDPQMYGLIQRSFKYLFSSLKKLGAQKIIRASYMEIYNEQVIDLLNNSHKKYLSVRWSKNKGFYVENLFTIECQTIDDLMAVLEEGLRNRQTGSHGLNEFSSRSHSVLTVTIDSESQPEPEDDNLYITKRGKLSFVDLAGSEKVKDSTNQGGSGMTESNSINKSLLVLGNCIQHLGDPKRRQGHIPYRDSKLTKLLADSLSGNGVTLMVACITPSSSNTTETMNTLRYASRAKKIKTKPTVKMDPREKLIITLKKEIKILRNENHYLRQQLDFPAKPKGQLQKENDEKFMKFMKDQQQKESGLYEMLQEYMVENEALRAENSEMHTVRDSGRREQQILYRENEKLQKRVEELERIMTDHPGTWSGIQQRRTDGYGQQDLSPRMSPVGPGYLSPKTRPTDLPISSGIKSGSPKQMGQPKRPPHHLNDHVTRPVQRPVEYIDDIHPVQSIQSKPPVQHQMPMQHSMQLKQNQIQQMQPVQHPIQPIQHPMQQMHQMQHQMQHVQHMQHPVPPVQHIQGAQPVSNGYNSPRQSNIQNTKQGSGGPRKVDRKASQISQSDLIRDMNEQLKKEVQQLDGEIQHHTRVVQGVQSNMPYYR